MKKIIISLILALSIFASLSVVSCAEDETTTGLIAVTDKSDEKSTVSDEYENTKKSVNSGETTPTTLTDIDDTSEVEDDTPTQLREDDENITTINIIVTEDNSEGAGTTAIMDDSESIPKTGDSSRVASAVIAFIASGAFITLMVLKKKRISGKPVTETIKENNNKNKGE